MAEYEVMSRSVIDSMWSTVLKQTDRFVSKDDLINLSDREVLNVADNMASMTSVELLRLKCLAYNSNEGIIDKLVTVYSAMHSIGATVFTIIKGKMDGSVDFYLGCRCTSKTSIAKAMLKSNFEGHFPGIEFEKIKAEDKKRIMDDCVPLEYSRKSVATLSISADYRMQKQEDTNSYIQGIEKFIDTMKGQDYTAMFIAEPISKEDCDKKQYALEDILTEVSKCSKVSVSYNESESRGLTESVSESLTDTLSKSLSESVSTNTSRSIGKSVTKSSGNSFSIMSFGFNKGRSKGESDTDTTGSGTSSSTTDGSSTSKGSTNTKGTSNNETRGMTYSINVENAHIASIQQKLEYERKKYDNASAFGLWDTAIYIISDEETAIIGANSIKALMVGDESGKSKSYINVWNGDSDRFHNGTGSNLFKFLHYGMHPVFYSDIAHTEYYITPAMTMDGKTLPTFLGLPLKSVPGVTVIETAEFGRNIVTDDFSHPGNRKVSLGEVLYMGKPDRTPVDLFANSLSSHTFVCGVPGSGKSNAVYNLMYNLINMDDAAERDEGYGSVKFLVVEPAKGEYKYEFGKLKGINIYTSNDNECEMLRLNPFEFPYKYMSVREHIERVKNLVSACWPLYGAMPAILSDAIEQAYMRVGWDLNNSVFVYPQDVVFPGFDDVLAILPKIIKRSGYSNEAMSNYQGALVTRVATLTRGVIGDIFSKKSTVPDYKLFDENTIIDLSNVGSEEAKALIMGSLVMKLENYRKSNATKANYPLRHVTILEEAHNLLPNVSTAQGEDSSNIQGMSVKAICNGIAEMRTYGEGFIIVDQSPSAVSKIAIANTSTKIIMRLSGREDIEAAGASVGLNEEQMKHINRLSQGQAIVKQGNWIDPVVTLVAKAPSKYFSRVLDFYEYNDLKMFRGDLLKKIYAVDVRDSKKGKLNIVDTEKIIKMIESENSIAPHYKDIYKEYWNTYAGMDGHNRSQALYLLVINILNCADIDKLFRLQFTEPEDAKKISESCKRQLRAEKNRLRMILENYVDAEPDVMDKIQEAIYIRFSKKAIESKHRMFAEMIMRGMDK